MNLSFSPTLMTNKVYASTIQWFSCFLINLQWQGKTLSMSSGKRCPKHLCSIIHLPEGLGKVIVANLWWIALAKVYCSLKLMQTLHLTILVTRLKCGGFIFATRVNHTLCDGCGIGQFIKAIAEIAQGASNPSIPPVWCRELLCARDPPRVTFIHHEYKQVPLDNDDKTVFLKPSQASFFFGPKEIDALRCLLPRHLAQSSTTFDILTACLWRCRTVALQWNPNKKVRLMYAINARFENCRFNRPLPQGYYGNAFVFPAAVCSVGMLCQRPLSYALELVKESKKKATEEYVHSVADLMAIKGRPDVILEGSLLVSDITKCGFRDVDFGWGKPLYSGLADTGGPEDIPGVSYFVPYTNSKGEHGRVLLICLPEEAIKRFEQELNGILQSSDQGY
ncbi:13-hydroxylupanine O-tigloyltransferase isoform X2 [Arachis hypogaea]|uniref:13-hydroxylupanine O-tigloyltransferase isoform X2 n=1 Tax=Arachis hypogaea TaxID=3818 RepID=UPI003B213CAE